VFPQNLEEGGIVSFSLSPSFSKGKS